LVASLRLAAGFAPREVRRGLGHAHPATTDAIYTHLYPIDCAAHVERREALVAELSARLP